MSLIVAKSEADHRPPSGSDSQAHSEDREAFIGLPDDLARLAIQRFMRSDLRRRSHERAGLIWQRITTILSALSALAASLAAVTYLQSWVWAAVALSIAVALFVPLNTALNCATRAAEHKQAATSLDALALKYERYIQLDLGPSMWRGNFSHVDELRRRLDHLDAELADASWVKLPRTSTSRASDIAAAEGRGQYLVEYLQMANVQLPPRSAWT